ncbi:MAG: prepilin-type N-terminal cleavage/methylation domain-containing protein [Kiritimatiellae bacterium]|nr:prepilin-type N-terminal cleavage/methylation domain-containing protein [Kiritimatiellia bacterium]
MNRRAFTLVEVLMVVVIIMITMAVAIPSFTRSFRGAKLRTSGRTLVMASRYARSVAVLQQVQTSLLFDSELNSCEVVSIATGGEEDKFLSEPDGSGQEAGEASVTSLLRHSLPEGVSILEVRGTGEDDVQEVEGIYYISYYPNGMCDAYEIELEDDRGKRMQMTVDPLSGKSAVEFLN